MNEKLPVDVFSQSREMMSQWEQALNALLTQHMSTSEFSKQIHESMASSAQAMKSLGKMPAPLSFATKEDVAEIGQRLQAIEEQLAYLTTLLERSPPQAAAARSKPKISRSKRFSKANPSKP
jgi:hypothetical protein